jgi:hypothetical protein
MNARLSASPRLWWTLSAGITKKAFSFAVLMSHGFTAWRRSTRFSRSFSAKIPDEPNLWRSDPASCSAKRVI